MEQKNNINTLFIIGGIVLFLAIIYFGKNGTFLSKINPGDYLWLGLFLLCPLMHLFMMRGHNHSSHNHPSHNHPSHNHPSHNPSLEGHDHSLQEQDHPSEESGRRP